MLRARRSFYFVLVICAGLLVLLMSLRARLTRPIIFPAPNMKLMPQLDRGELIKVAAERTVFGYYAPGGKKLIVFFHGNGEVMGSMQDLANVMQRAGFSVLMAEYPGYGFAAQQEVSESNIYHDAAALLRHMREARGHDAADTVLWGFSLGTGVATEMAAQKLGSRLILMAPLTSAGDAAEHHFFALARWLVVDQFDNKAKAAKIDMPVLIVHGESDTVLPASMGKELAATFPRAQFISLARADHNDLFTYFDAGLWQRLIRFAQGQ